MIGGDPLDILPTEIVLQIIDLTSVTDVTRLAQVSRSWHHFIDVLNVNRIFGHYSKAGSAREKHDLTHHTFTKCFDNISGCKSFCERRNLLRRNWTAQIPETCETYFSLPNLDILQFRADFRRRFFITTSVHREINVICMDTGVILWSHLGSNYSGLEYDASTGIAVWPRRDHTLECWETEESKRGHFRRVRVWHTQLDVYSFSLRHNTTCALTSSGQVWILDKETGTSTKVVEMENLSAKTSRVSQDEDMLFYGVPEDGIYAHSKNTGERIGKIEPHRCSTYHHIDYKRPWFRVAEEDVPLFLCDGELRRPLWDRRLQPVPIKAGPHPCFQLPVQVEMWGSLALQGSFMAALSTMGRIFICQDYPRLLAGRQEDYDETCVMIECNCAYGTAYWLQLHSRRVSVQVNDSIFMVSFDNRRSGCPGTAWRIDATLSDDIEAPAFGCIEMCHDAFMHTYTIRHESRRADNQDNSNDDEQIDLPVFDAIRVLTLAPVLQD